MSTSSLFHRFCVTGIIIIASAAANIAGAITVCTPPNITLQPGDQGVIEMQVATFIINATGTDLNYQWQRMNSGDVVWDSIPGAIDTTYAITTKLSDNSAKFRCRVSGQCGSALSNDAALSVYQRAQASFHMSINGKADSISPAPAAVRFTDMSSGAVSMWLWSYGDGKRDTVLSAGAIRDHQYDSAGAYIVKLVVQGPGGIDSISRKLTVYSTGTGGNPIVIIARYLAPDSVMLDLMNFGSLKVAPAAPPTVAMVKIWCQMGALPSDITTAKLLKSYPLSTLKAGGSIFTDTVKVDPLVSPNTTYGFMTQIVWDDGRTSPFNTFNGSILFISLAPGPKNRLVVSGAFTPWDTVTFYFDSVQTIDSMADSIGLWYGIGEDSIPEFASSTNPAIKWWKAADIKGETGNRFVYVKKDYQFNTDRKVLNCAVVIKSQNKLYSDTVKGRFMIGRVRPVNPVVLHVNADTAASSIIRLTWNRFAIADSMEKIRIYYRTGSVVPLQYDFTGLQLDSIIVVPQSLNDTMVLVTNLFEQTRYYFGAQVYKQGMWSLVTPASSANDSTPPVKSCCNAVLPKQVQVLSFVCNGSSKVLRYTIPSQCYVSLDYYDVRGKAVASPINQMQKPGYYSLSLPLSSWARGTYIQVFRAGSFIKRDRVVLLK